MFLSSSTALSMTGAVFCSPFSSLMVMVFPSMSTDTMVAFTWWVLPAASAGETTPRIRAATNTAQTTAASFFMVPPQDTSGYNPERGSYFRMCSRDPFDCGPVRLASGRAALLYDPPLMRDHGKSGWPLEPVSADLRRLIDACAAYVVEHVDSLPEQPSFDVDGAADLASTFDEPAPDEGRPIEAVLARLGPAIAKSFTTAGPGYLAFIPGGGIPAAALADFVATSVNRFVGVAAAAPALARIEAQAIAWLAGLMGYPPASGGILTSGGSLSNLVALVAARVAKLPEDFLDGTIYLSDETHLSVLKAARVAGFPDMNVRRIPVDGRFRLRPDRLQAAIEEDRAAGRRPFFVVANVGTTNTGAIDPLPEILDIARRHELWVHADAAYGGFFRLIPEGAGRMPGV